MIVSSAEFGNVSKSPVVVTVTVMSNPVACGLDIIGCEQFATAHVPAFATVGVPAISGIDLRITIVPPVGPYP